MGLGMVSSYISTICFIKNFWWKTVVRLLAKRLFGFIDWIGNVNWPPQRVSDSDVFSVSPSSDRNTKARSRAALSNIVNLVKGLKTIDIFTYDLFHHRSFSRWSNTVVSLYVVRLHVPSTKCPHSSTSCYSTGSLQVLPVVYQSWLYFLSSTTKGIFHDAYLNI